MKFFDTFTALYFSKDSAGMTVFYPYGKSRSSYLIRTEAEKAKIAGGLRTHFVRLTIYLVLVIGLGQLKYFHTLTHFSSYMQTVFLVGAAGVWAYRNFMTETTAALPPVEKKIAKKSMVPQIAAVIVLLLLVGFVIVMSTKLPQGKLPSGRIPESPKAPVAIPATN